MNTRKGKAKFNKFRILFNSGCSSMIALRRLITKFNPKEGAVIQCHTQAGNITNILKVKQILTYLNLARQK